MEIPIIADVRQFKTKDVGNFTFKEAGLIAIGAASALFCWKVLNLPTEIAVAPMIVLILFAFLKPQGMTLWQFLTTVVGDNLKPRTYYYQSDFEFDPERLREVYGEDVQFLTGFDDSIQKESKPLDKAAAKAEAKAAAMRQKQEAAQLIR